MKIFFNFTGTSKSSQTIRQRTEPDAQLVSSLTRNDTRMNETDTELIGDNLNAPLVNGQVVLAYVQAMYLIYLGQRLKRPILLKPWSSG